MLSAAVQYRRWSSVGSDGAITWWAASPQSTPIPPKRSAAGITNSGNPRNDGTSSSSVQFPNHWNISTPRAIGTNSHR